MKKEVKIILNSGVSITIAEGDVVVLNIKRYDGYEKYEIKQIEDIPMILMSAKDDIIIYHHITTGEYMEYYLTRDKISWCYFSEVPEKDEEEG